MTLVLIILFSTLTFAQLEQPTIYAKADLPEYDIWYSAVIDSAWLGVNNDYLEFVWISPTTGQEIWGYGLPKHPGGHYKYWAIDENGDIIPRRTYRRKTTETLRPKYTVMIK